MCFSATASFTATSLLVPMGIYASKVAWEKDSKYLPLATFPLAFGIQQGCEGIEWVGLDSHQADMVQLGALGFLFFSHGFWLVWPALTVFVLENRPWIKTLLLTIACIGFLFGIFLYGPLLLYPDWFPIAISQGAIDYQSRLVYNHGLPQDISRLIYMLIVLSPLCLSELAQLKILGGLIALSVLITYCFFNYAFVSVWCFFAAVVSLYVIYILYSISILSSTSLESDGF